MPACACRAQREPIGGCPCVVHGLRAAQPGEGDAFTSPQPGKRWATGGQPRCDGGSCVLLILRGAFAVARQALLNGVAADAGTRRGKIERKACSDRDAIARPQRRHRHPTAVTALAVRYSAARHSAAPLRTAATAAPAASALSCASAFSRVLRSHTLGVLPRDCVPPLRACTKPCPAGVQPVRWCRTPCAPAAASIRRCPRPRIARKGLAPHHVRHARSRGFGPSVDITRDDAQASCLCGAACRVLRHASPRPRNPSLCQRPSSTSVCSPR